MKANELRDKSVEELQAQLRDLYKDQFNNRMQSATGQHSAGSSVEGG